MARSKPTNAMREATKAAKSKDYKRLVAAASEVVIRTRQGSEINRGRSGTSEYIVVDFPYFVKFQAGFPPRTLVEKTDSTNTYQINAVKLLDWLHKKGYSAYNAKQLVLRTKEFERASAVIERMFDDDF